MMATFIAQRIILAANVSLANGQAKYRAYFVNTALYLQYKAAVDSILENTFTEQYPNGYGDCIVVE